MMHLTMGKLLSLPETASATGISWGTLRRYADIWQNTFAELPTDSRRSIYLSPTLVNVFVSVYGKRCRRQRLHELIDEQSNNAEVLLSIAMEYHHFRSQLDTIPDLVTTLLIRSTAMASTERKQLTSTVEASLQSIQDDLEVREAWDESIHRFLYELVGKLYQVSELSSELIHPQLLRDPNG